MLRISVDWLVFAQNPIEDTWWLLVIDLSFLSEVDASNPLMLYFLERRLDFEDGG